MVVAVVESSSDGGNGGFQKLIMYQKVIRIFIHLHQSATPLPPLPQF